MAYSMTFRKRGSIISCSGFLNLQDIHDINGVLYGDARFDKHTYQIWNLLNVDLSQITEDEITELAATDWAAGLSVPKMQVALVVRDDHAVKICEHYRKKLNEFESKWECQLFDSMDDAQEWVDS